MTQLRYTRTHPRLDWIMRHVLTYACVDPTYALHQLGPDDVYDVAVSTACMHDTRACAHVSCRSVSRWLTVSVHVVCAALPTG